MSFELVIKNGKIVDGSGNPWFRADITIFDYAKIRDMFSPADPACNPEGIEYVLMNGRLIKEGKK